MQAIAAKFEVKQSSPLQKNVFSLNVIQVYFEKRRARKEVLDPSVPRRHLNMLNTIAPSTDGTNKYIQVSISPTFYEQLLRTQISKAQKNTVNLSVFFCIFGNCACKSFELNVGEIIFVAKYFFQLVAANEMTGDSAIFSACLFECRILPPF
jgi:hypothetical protein